jgi:glycosyltransferase involved in cell wall biosynthesis
LNKKIKVLFISHSPFFNGAEICLLTLTRNISREKFVPIVVFPHEGPLVEEMKKLDIKTYITPLERWIRYEHDKPVMNADVSIRVKKIMDIIEKESIDIVHTNTSVIFEGAIAAKKKGVPHIWHVHEFLIDHPELRAALPVPIIYSIISGLSYKIVAVSNFVKNQFDPMIDSDKIVTIYDGIEEDKETLKDNFLRGNFGIKENEIIAVSIGLLNEAKGYINFLQAAYEVKQKGGKVKFLWVGGASKKDLRDFNSRIKKLRLKDSVFYLGFRSDVDSILKCSDFLICSSQMETLSLVILEAMAAGLPVITTNCGGPSECVVEGITGYIVPVNDSKTLSEKIIELSGDEKMRKMYGMNARMRYSDFFTAKVYTRSFEDLYMRTTNDKKKIASSVKENILIESCLKLYRQISEHHWGTLKN